jgi:hypothetical protein
LDVLLDESKSGNSPTIVRLELSETFHRDDEEDLLTNEELEKLKAEAALEERIRDEGWLNDPSLDPAKRDLVKTLFPEMYDSWGIPND